MLAPGGRLGWLRRSQLPAPLHLAASLLRYPYLGMRERLALAWAMQRLALGRRGRSRQRRVVVRRLACAATARARAAVEAIWELITRPTVNLTVDDASLAQAAQVFQIGLLEDAAAGDIGWAVVPLGEIHDRAAAARSSARGVERAPAQHRSGDRSAWLRGDGASGPRDFTSTRAMASARASTRWWWRCRRRARRSCCRSQAGLDAGVAERLGSSPIVNLHVVYDRRVLEHPFAAGVGTPVQWVFDRTRRLGARGRAVPGGLAVGGRRGAACDRRGAARRATCRRWPSCCRPAAGATVREFFVTREHAATFRAAPGARASRPGRGPGLPGWCWPAPGPTPAGRRRWRARCAAVTRPHARSWRRSRMSDRLSARGGWGLSALMDRIAKVR